MRSARGATAAQAHSKIHHARGARRHRGATAQRSSKSSLHILIFFLILRVSFIFGLQRGSWREFAPGSAVICLPGCDALA